MTDKDPKDMTVSELLRWSANYTMFYHWGNPWNKLAIAILGLDPEKARAQEVHVTDAFSRLADKIDAELAQARELSLRAGAELWAKANGWPYFRDGEDFGAWLERCALKRPCYEDGEPVRDSSEWKAIMMSLDGSRFQLLKSYPDGLCFTGSPVKRPDPDTQERIDADAVKGSNDYWGCHGYQCLQCPSLLDGENPCERYDTGTDCGKAMRLDLLRRQRELDARKGGAE